MKCNPLILGAVVFGVLIARAPCANAADEGYPEALRFTSASLDAVVSRKGPGFESLSIDGLALGRRGANVLRPGPTDSGDFEVSAAVSADGRRYEYRHRGADAAAAPASWTIELGESGIRLVSDWSEQGAPKPLTLAFDTRHCYATLLGLLNPAGAVVLPALLHLPGEGSLRITTKEAEDAARYRAAAAKLRAAYFKTFFDPRTGVIAGWRSADGQLHDYYFLWVNGIAIHYGLVPPERADGIMDVLMAKMKEVGYTNFHMGLPGNLVTVPLKDYVHRLPDGRFGGGVREDNADGFQKYENGGATGSFAYFTLAALYDLGRRAEADRILFPMLDEYGRGGFEGRGARGFSNDWRMWDGTPMGYEGFLTDNYYAPLAVTLRAQK